MSVIAPVHASSVLTVQPYNEECQEFPDEFPSTNYGETNQSEIMAKIPDNVTLTLDQAKFLEESPGTIIGVKTWLISW